ncbi:MAG: S-formylglutathione hydrolase [Pseudomonadota bacterium]
MLETVSTTKIFNGTQGVYAHESELCQCTMRFAVFVPPQASENHRRLPVVYWLSGLTCTEENFITKAGAQRLASELGLILVAPDTSPRGPDVPDDPEGGYDLGLGAGFYVNATQVPWAVHYQMADYITQELRALIEANFPVDPEAAGICGHSMGGHGALTLYLKNQNLYRSCSAFAPIVAPSQVPWGRKALNAYLGPHEESWRTADAVHLLTDHGPSDQPILIDQGTEDIFLDDQLKPHLFASAAQEVGQPVTLRMRDGYDHSYNFIATFIDDHMRWHHQHLIKE